MQISDQEWQCRLLYQFADKDFIFLCDSLEGGVIRRSIEMMTGQPELWYWIFSYSLTEEELVRRASPLMEHIKKELLLH